MSFLAANILLALAWAALWNDFSPLTLCTGFVFGYAGLWFARGLAGARQDRYFRRIPKAVVLLLYFLKELVKSCLMVARDCIARRPALKPAIVRMPLDGQGDLEIYVLSSLITLTPGTLTLDVAEDRSCLVIHSIYADDPEALVADLQSGMARRVREVFR